MSPFPRKKHWRAKLTAGRMEEKKWILIKAKTKVQVKKRRKQRRDCCECSSVPQTFVTLAICVRTRVRACTRSTGALVLRILSVCVWAFYCWLLAVPVSPPGGTRGRFCTIAPPLKPPNPQLWTSCVLAVFLSQKKNLTPEYRVSNLHPSRARLFTLHLPLPRTPLLCAMGKSTLIKGLLINPWSWWLSAYMSLGAFVLQSCSSAVHKWSNACPNVALNVPDFAFCVLFLGGGGGTSYFFVFLWILYCSQNDEYIHFNWNMCFFQPPSKDNSSYHPLALQVLIVSLNLLFWSKICMSVFCMGGLLDWSCFKKKKKGLSAK